MSAPMPLNLVLTDAITLEADNKLLPDTCYKPLCIRPPPDPTLENIL